MPDIPPTTSESMLNDDALYEQEYGESETDGEDICGVELDRGGVCERPAGECPYHDD